MESIQVTTIQMETCYLTGMNIREGGMNQMIITVLCYKFK